MTPTRRDFLTAGIALPLLPAAAAAQAPAVPVAAGSAKPAFGLGTVTYNLGAAWDLPTLLAACREAGFGAVELRTTHAHGVEPSISTERRREVRKQCSDAGILLWGLGSVCEFHSPDPAEVRRNIETCADFCKLAADVGARGVKVRPNGFPKEVERAKTLEQIGKALAECGRAAAGHGVEIWLEVHGPGTSEPAHIRTILDHCGHPAVGVCWNSNATDVKDGSIAAAFDLLGKDIRSCHINELWSGYPWREFFRRLREAKYDRWTLAEIPPVPEAAGAARPEAAIRFMRYYRALWNEQTKANGS